MAFTNKIRLPFTLLKAQFPLERTAFRKANGVTQTISAVIRKTYAGETDNIPEAWHQRLIIALNHDSVFVSSDRYVGEITMEENNYQVGWSDFKDYPFAKAEFQVQATPFDATNVNCASCEELTQLDLVDDTITGLISAGGSGSINAFANDTICCSPITAEIIAINPSYVDSATIDATTGVVVVNVKSDAVSVTNAQLATYRVTCPNGNFDDADIIGSIDGVAPEVCPPPTDVEISSITSNSARIDANNLNDAIIKISKCSAPATILFEGAFTSPYFIGDHFTLIAGTCYQVEIYNFCDPEVSTSVTDTFDTLDAPPEETCGQFNLTLNDFRPPGQRLTSCSVNYTACGGANVTVFVANHNPTPVQICAKTTTPGVPDFLTTNAVVGFSYTHIGPC